MHRRTLRPRSSPRLFLPGSPCLARVSYVTAALPAAVHSQHNHSYHCRSVSVPAEAEGSAGRTARDFMRFCGEVPARRRCQTREVTLMRLITGAALLGLIATASATGPAQAEGCLKGAAVGGVAGHV